MDEDDYEYALMQTSANGEDLVNRLLWGSLKEAQEEFDLLNRGSSWYSYRIVKRRKAGEIEDA